MNPEQITGLVILGSTLLAFVGITLWFFLEGIKPKWPHGPVISKASRKSLHAVLIWGEGVAVDPDFVNVALDAAEAVKKAWVVIRPAMSWDLETFGVHILTDEEFEATYAFGKPFPQAYLIKALQRVGNPPPLVVMRESLLAHTKTTGNILIHELLHNADAPVLYYDGDHRTKDVWDMPGSSDETIEFIAGKFYKEKRDHS